MASGRKHWRIRLARLSREPGLGRAGRRQLRKLLGRAYACEWRLFGNRLGATYYDAHHAAVAARVKQDGHVADRLKAAAGRDVRFKGRDGYYEAPK